MLGLRNEHAELKAQDLKKSTSRGPCTSNLFPVRTIVSPGQWRQLHSELHDNDVKAARTTSSTREIRR
jgi:hypothetical protein